MALIRRRIGLDGMAGRVAIALDCLSEQGWQGEDGAGGGGMYVGQSAVSSGVTMAARDVLHFGGWSNLEA